MYAIMHKLKSRSGASNGGSGGVESGGSSSSENVINSGNFMATKIHEDSDEDAEIDVVTSDADPNGQKSTEYHHSINKNREHKPVTYYKFGPKHAKSIDIDVSLKSLNKCINFAYKRLTTPKWKYFHGLKVSWKERIRLNNIIWRSWHMEFQAKVVPKYCCYAVPNIEDKHDSHAEEGGAGSVLEGMYWKRRVDAVCAQYKQWRLQQLPPIKRCAKAKTRRRANSRSGNGHPGRTSMDDGAVESLYLPHPIGMGNASGGCTSSTFENDDFANCFTDKLFESLNQAYMFPDPKEMAQSKNADFIQPSLIQLQPSLEDIMASLETAYPIESDPLFSESQQNSPSFFRQCSDSNCCSDTNNANPDNNAGNFTNNTTGGNNDQRLPQKNMLLHDHGEIKNEDGRTLSTLSPPLHNHSMTSDCCSTSTGYTVKDYQDAALLIDSRRLPPSTTMLYSQATCCKSSSSSTTLTSTTSALGSGFPSDPYNNNNPGLQYQTPQLPHHYKSNYHNSLPSTPHSAMQAPRFYSPAAPLPSKGSLKAFPSTNSSAAVAPAFASLPAPKTAIIKGTAAMVAPSKNLQLLLQQEYEREMMSNAVITATTIPPSTVTQQQNHQLQHINQQNEMSSNLPPPLTDVHHQRQLQLQRQLQQQQCHHPSQPPPAATSSSSSITKPTRRSRKKEILAKAEADRGATAALSSSLGGAARAVNSNNNDKFSISSTGPLQHQSALTTTATNTTTSPSVSMIPTLHSPLQPQLHQPLEAPRIGGYGRAFSPVGSPGGTSSSLTLLPENQYQHRLQSSNGNNNISNNNNNSNHQNQQQKPFFHFHNQQHQQQQEQLQMIDLHSPSTSSSAVALKPSGRNSRNNHHTIQSNNNNSHSAPSILGGHHSPPQQQHQQQQQAHHQQNYLCSPQQQQQHLHQSEQQYVPHHQHQHEPLSFFVPPTTSAAINFGMTSLVGGSSSTTSSAAATMASAATTLDVNFGQKSTTKSGVRTAAGVEQQRTSHHSSHSTPNPSSALDSSDDRHYQQQPKSSLPEIAAIDNNSSRHGSIETSKSSFSSPPAHTTIKQEIGAATNSSSNSNRTTNKSEQPTTNPSSFTSSHELVLRGGKFKTATKRAADSTMDPSERKRMLHLHAEQSRRSALKTGFEQLEEIVPNLNMGVKNTNAAILARATEHIVNLKSGIFNRRQELEMLRTQTSQLNQTISLYQSHLPSTRGGVGRAGDKGGERGMDAELKAAVKERIDRDWKSALLWKLCAELWISFKRTSTENGEEEEQEAATPLLTPTQWAQRSCNIMALRPVMSEMLVKLATDSSVLSDPESLPDYARNQCKSL